MAKPTHAQRPPAFAEPPALKAGQERRWLALLDRESREEALARARRTMPWGLQAIGVPVRAPTRWVFTIENGGSSCAST